MGDLKELNDGTLELEYLNKREHSNGSFSRAEMSFRNTDCHVHIFIHNEEDFEDMRSFTEKSAKYKVTIEKIEE